MSSKERFVSQEGLQRADMVAKALLDSDEARVPVKAKVIGGPEVDGIAFGNVVVTDEALLLTQNGKVVKVLPRK